MKNFNQMKFRLYLMKLINGYKFKFKNIIVINSLKCKE